MKSKEVKQAVTDKTQKANELLSERVEIVNHISASVFNIAKEGGSGSPIEPFHDVDVEVNESNIIAKGKDEKFQKIDSEIKQLIDSSSKEISVAQDSHANNSTEKGKDIGNTEHLKEEIKQNQEEMNNKKSEIGELDAKISEISQQKHAQEMKYDGIHTLKEDLLQGLPADQLSTLTLGDSSTQNDGTQLMGGDSSS